MRIFLAALKQLGNLLKAKVFPVFAVASLLTGTASAQDRQLVDLELVLAVDSSTSVSSQEFDLQMRGLASAFREPAVVQAIAAAGDRGIAVAVVQWSNNYLQTIAVDWTLIRNQDDALAFASLLDETPRFVHGGGTSIGGAIEYSIRQLEINQFHSTRRVIDVSGDGRSNQGKPPEVVRDVGVQLGIVINGLAILNEDPLINLYYERFVIGGTGAFVQSATSYEDFGTAMLEKLVREISGVPVAGGGEGERHAFLRVSKK